MITFRPANPSDLELTYFIKSNALRPYIQLIWGWNQAIKTQYYEYHRNNFNPHDIEILVYEGSDIGYLETQNTADQLIIKNICILEEFQNKKIGSFLLRQLIEDAHKAGKSIQLDVFKVNEAAQRLYKKLGFRVIAEKEIKLVMKIH